MSRRLGALLAASVSLRSSFFLFIFDTRRAGSLVNLEPRWCGFRLDIVPLDAECEYESNDGHRQGRILPDSRLA